MKRRKPLKPGGPIKRKPGKKKPKLSSVKAKPKKKTPKQRLEKEADKLMGKFIRGDGRCFFSGKVDFKPYGVTQNCHLERRSRSAAIKFSALNGIPGDMTPHVKHDNSQLDWGVFLHKWMPGRAERLCAMKNWALAHSGLFVIEDVIRANIAWYKKMLDAETYWWEWHHSGACDDYIDPIEALMEKLG